MEYYESDFHCIAPVKYESGILENPRAGEPEKKHSTFWHQCVISCFLCVILLSLKVISPDAAEKARSWFVADEIGVVEQAAEAMLDGLMHGQSFSDAVVVFCQDVIDGQNPN